MTWEKSRPVVIIPAYRPDENLPGLLSRLRALVPLPVVVVDDGSGSAYEDIFHRLETLPETVVCRHPTNRGKGMALKTGVDTASRLFENRTGYVTADADGQHSPEDIVRVAACLCPESMILGIRDFSAQQVPLRSRLGNRISSFLFLLSTGTRCPDTQSGLRGIPKSCEQLFLSTEGQRYEFEMNFLLRVIRGGVPLVFLPVQTIYQKGNPSSHFHPLADSMRVFGGILKFACSSFLCALTDLTLYCLLGRFLFGTNAVGLFSATVAARLCSGGMNFLLNQKWVFHGGNSVAPLKYAALFCAQMTLSALTVAALSEFLGGSILCKLLVDCILFCISYQVQKRFVFTGAAAIKGSPTS